MKLSLDPFQRFGRCNHWSVSYILLDGTYSTVRVVLFDFENAFDLIDHSILAEKLGKLDLPYGILYWIIDFLKSRKQRVKLASDCNSEWRNIQAGVPQGTKLGPWLFVLMIKDIDITDNDTTGIVVSAGI